MAKLLHPRSTKRRDPLAEALRMLARRSYSIADMRRVTEIVVPAEALAAD